MGAYVKFEHERNTVIFDVSYSLCLTNAFGLGGYKYMVFDHTKKYMLTITPLTQKIHSQRKQKEATKGQINALKKRKIAVKFSKELEKNLEDLNRAIAKGRLE